MFGDDLFSGVAMFGGGGPYTGVQNFGGGGYVAPTPAPVQTLVQNPYTAQQPLYTGYQQPTQIVTNPALQPSYAPPATNFMSNYLGGNTQAPLTNPTGQGGDYNDQFNVPYSPPAGGADLMAGNPFGNSYGGLSNSAATGGAGLSFDNWAQQNGWSNHNGIMYTRNSGGGDEAVPGFLLRAQYDSAFGDLSGNPFGQPIGMGYQAPSTGVQMPTTPGTFGDLSNSSNQLPSATGGATLQAGTPAPAPVPSVSLTPSAPAAPVQMPTTSQAYGDLSGASGLAQPPNPYGSLSSAAASGGAGLSFDNWAAQNRWWNTRGDTYSRGAGEVMNRDQLMAQFNASYQPQAPLPPPRPSSLDTGGAGLQSSPPAVNTTAQNPAQPYQNPTTGSTYGNLSGVTGALAPYSDQSYMDAGQGPYGSLLGADDQPSTTVREGLDGTQYPNPPQPLPPVNSGYTPPSSPLVLPTSPASASSAPPVSASQQFAQGMTQNNPAYGDLAHSFDMQGSLYAGLTDKNTDRVPQTGGFVSYGAAPSFDTWAAQNGWWNTRGDTYSRGASGVTNRDALRSQYGALYPF